MIRSPSASRAGNGLRRRRARADEPWRRAGRARPSAHLVVWCAHAPAAELPEGAALTLALGLHTVEIDTRRLKSGHSIDLTYRFEPSGKWAGRDFRISVVPAGEAAKTALARSAQA